MKTLLASIGGVLLLVAGLIYYVVTSEVVSEDQFGSRPTESFSVHSALQSMQPPTVVVQDSKKITETQKNQQKPAQESRKNPDMRDRDSRLDGAEKDVHSSENSNTGEIDANRTLLQNYFDAEPLDRSWSSHYEKEILDRFDKAEFGSEIRISDVQCRTSICRLEIVYESLAVFKEKTQKVGQHLMANEPCEFHLFGRDESDPIPEQSVRQDLFLVCSQVRKRG